MGRQLLGDGGADAAGKAANEQRRVAGEQYNEIKGITERATVAGISSYEDDIVRQDKNLARQEQLISQIDPTIIEASQQALKLLRGEDSSTLNPLRRQRDMQRQKLLTSLREQMGPGAETSSAGMQALNRFDSETSNLLSGAQQSTLQGLGGIATSFNSTRPDMLREISARSAFGQGGTNLRMQQAGLLGGAGRDVLNTAGNQYTGDILAGKQDKSFNQGLLNMAVAGGTAYLTGGASSAPKGQQAGGSYADLSNMA